VNAATRAVVTDYTTAVSDGDFERLTQLVHPDATFGGTVMTEAKGVEAFVQGFRNLRPITLRTDVRNVVVEDDHAAILYELVTDTPVGSVLCSEFLTIDTDRIRASTLIFDWRHWPQVLEELRSRATTPVD
jgi:hypothetical protein